MSHTKEDTNDGRVCTSKQFLCPSSSSEGVFQEKYDISNAHHIKRVISERYILEKRHMSSSPTPNKHARVDDGSEKKELGETKMEYVVDASDDVVHIKSEPPDDNEKDQTRNEPVSFENSFSRIRSNSLHSTTTSYSRKSDGNSSKLHSTTRAPVLTHPGRVRPRCQSVSSERPSIYPGNVKIGDTLHDQPDSSTGTCEQLMRGNSRRNIVSSLNLTDDETAIHLPATTSTCSGEAILCQVCGDLAAGFYCDAYICEACKKFFIRASKLERPRYVCLRQKDCIITKESRVHCQYCRYQKCLQLSMHYSKDGQKSTSKVGVQEIPCRVCSAPSSGFHFGALTCEGCKGFFRRMVKEREAYSYKCSRSGNCDVNAMTRNMCKACRYNKCLQIGMSVEGSRIGRQPNAVKHALSLEAKKQAALKTETESYNDDNSSPSNFSFESVILDPCLPGEVVDSFHSVDTDHNSTSVDALTSPSRKTDEAHLEQKPSAASSQDSCVSDGVEQDISSSASKEHSDVFRIPHPILPLTSHHCEHLQDPYSASLSSSSMSFSSTPRKNNQETFGKPHAESFSDSYDNQPQDLSINMSVPRTTNASSSFCTSHPTVASSKPNNFSSVYPPHECHRPLSSPLPKAHSSNSSYISPADYNPQTQHTFHQPYFVSQEEHHMSVYHHRGSYGNSSPSYITESYNPYCEHNTVQRGRNMSQQEIFIDRLDCHRSQPQDHFSSTSPGYIRQEDIIQDHHQMSHYHQHESEHLHRSEPLLTRHDSRDDLCTHYADQHLYTSPCSLHSFPEKSCLVCDPLQQHTFKLHSHQWSHCTSEMPPQSPSYVSSHVQPPSPAVTPTSFVQKEIIPSPATTPNYDILNAPSPAPIPEKIAAARDQNYMNMSNEELHIVLLEAAKNLAHFCVVPRAKSDRFDVDRFKDVDSTWEKMMEHFHFHAKCIVRFAKRVPGFRRLKIDDQVVLLRMATYSLVILNHSRAYEPETGFYNYFNFTQKEILRIREFFPEFDVIHSHYKHTGTITHMLGLEEMEYAYMSCMLLLNDEYSGLEDVERTKELKGRYMEAFHEYELEHFSNGNLRFSQILQHLSEFSQISMEHNIAVGLVITKNSQLHIPQLYAEMYA